MVVVMTLVMMDLIQCSLKEEILVYQTAKTLSSTETKETLRE
jgi:hypothetical protein